MHRGRRLLLVGAAATGIWLLGSLGHSAADAEGVSPRPAAPPASTVSNQLTGLPVGQPVPVPHRARPAGTARTAQLAAPTTAARITVAGSGVVVQPAPVTATAAGLPALSAPRLDSVPKPALLPSLLDPIRVVVLPAVLPAALGQAGGQVRPGALAYGSPRWTAPTGEATLGEAVFGTGAADRPGPARPAIGRPARQPAPGRPNLPPPALPGPGPAGSAEFERHLPLAVLPATDPAGPAGRRGAGSATGSPALPARSRTPDVAPD
ncbi:MAG: hypothetical protein ACJ74U_00445 [Jatrophihabitantaceae bacterium]